MRLVLPALASSVSKTTVLGGLILLVACDAGPQFGVAPPSPVPLVVAPLAHVISGILADRDGRPIPGAWVEYNASFDTFESVGVKLDSVGGYRIDLSANWRYVEVRARSDDLGWAYAPVAMLKLDSLPDTIRVDFTLERR